MKYTPGPWHVIHDHGSKTENDIYIQTGQGEDVCYMNLETDIHIIKVNANLIASAPRLFEACKEALTALKDHTDLHEDTKKNLMESIAKAKTGEIAPFCLACLQEDCEQCQTLKKYKEEINMAPRIVITISGGLIENIFSDQPVEVLELDFDADDVGTENEDEGEIITINTTEGEVEQIYSTTPYDSTLAPETVKHYFDQIV